MTHNVCLLKFVIRGPRNANAVLYKVDVPLIQRLRRVTVRHAYVEPAWHVLEKKRARVLVQPRHACAGRRCLALVPKHAFRGNVNVELT